MMLAVRNSWWKCLSSSPPSTTGSVERKHTGQQATGWVASNGPCSLTGSQLPAQGGISILGMVDVPGIVQLQFQQSKPCKQFFDRGWTFQD